MGDLPRAVIVCPGGGGYTSASLGSLPPENQLVQRAEALRVEYGLEPLLELDGAERFDPPRHLRPANASPLTFLATLLDVERASADHRIVALVGSSPGWYAALAIGAALPFDDAFRLVQEMALLHEQATPQGGAGGQVIYPLLDADWMPVPDLRAAVADVLADGHGSAGRVFESIDLGSYAVLAGDEHGVARLLERLPAVKVGDRQFPLRLALAGPDHTPLGEHVAEAASNRLAGLRWQRPSVTLVDGRGARWTPWSTDPVALADYTLGEQLVRPYRFATCLRVALREHAPDVLVLPGPGSSLGTICGQLVVAEGYRGIRTRADFDAAQRSRAPVVLSMRR